MGFVKDFLVTTGIMAVGLALLGRKQTRELDELYQTYADALGIRVDEAKVKLEEAGREQAAARQREAVRKRQQKADARAAREHARELCRRMKAWQQPPGPHH